MVMDVVEFIFSYSTKILKNKYKILLKKHANDLEIS